MLHCKINRVPQRKINRVLQRSIIPLAAALALAGCYSPSPPTGAYLCGADGACPSGQHCGCGLCVAKDSDAACSFTLSFPKDGATPTVNEHQPLSLTVTALAKDGTPASGFNGTVTLASSWGDVSPTSLALANGTASANITLNRETLAPAVATVAADFHGNHGSSPGVNVVAPKFTVQPNPILPPFGWATRYVADASVEKSSDGYRMYFFGDATATSSGIGVATSTDGVTFSPAAQPVFTKDNLFSPSVYQAGGLSRMAYSTAGNGTNDIELANSPDGLQPFTSPANPVLLGQGQCAYCAEAVTFPQVVADLAGAVDGGTPPWLMFFSAVDGSSQVSIGRASSTDGVTWTPEPAPILEGTLGGETVLLSPRVLVDGSVYKMWYSYQRGVQFCDAITPCPGALVCGANHFCTSPPSDPLASFCEATASVSIGYATSADGFYWTRSESNPVVDVGIVSPTDHSLLVSGVIPTDGSDPASGVTIYYSPFRRVASIAGRCIPNDIVRAVRP